MGNSQTHYRTCHLCEALCGIEVEVDEGKVLSIRGDKADVFSKGHICPKAAAIADLQEDPDRLRGPVKADGKGGWLAVSWEDALSDIATRVVSLRNQHGPDSVGFYNGNPCAHNYGIITHGAPLSRLLKTKNRYSATSVDQLPQHLVGLKLYGHQSMLPVPDLDHTDLWIILGGNPVASNGSIMTAPNVKGRIKAIKARGGRVLTIDPRRTETADAAGEHLFIRPGSDAALLLGVLNVLFTEGLTVPSAVLDLLDGVPALENACAPYSPGQVERVTGVAAQDIRKIARDLSAAKRACLYGRMGVSVQRFGGLCHYLIQAINLLTGHVDAPGGLMFPAPAVDLLPHTNPGSFGRYRSRVDGLPEFSGEFPASIMANEIQTPGEGQLRALFVIAGNPVLSTPGGRMLDSVLGQLDFMVSLDMYVTETSRHADYILPPTGPLEKDHFGLFFHALSVRNSVKYSKPTLEKPDGAMHDWEILIALAEQVAAAMDQEMKPAGTPQDMLRASLKRGRYDVTFEDLENAPHGIDLGPLQPCLPARLFTADGRITLDQALYLDDIDRVQRDLLDAPAAQFTLIGRRHVRSNNSWLHNAQRLVKGPDRCTAMLHPDSAAMLGIADGAALNITSAAGSITVAAELTEGIMPGVVSVPHGWGHSRKGVKLRVASAHAGVSVNDVTDPQYFDPLSGNAAVNGVPVTIAAH